jgi:large subunit ribosomal protein L22
MKAILRSIRITPQKANLVAGMVRRKTAQESLDILKFTPKKAAKILHKLLNSAIANAVNNFKQDEKSLVIKEIVVTKGPTFKRGVPVSRGRVYPILKRTSNITITLEVSEEPTPNKEAKKSETTAKKITKKASTKASTKAEETKEVTGEKEVEEKEEESK